MAKTQNERIVTLDDQADTTSAVPAAEERATEVVGANFDDQLSGDKVKVEINESDGVGGKDDVFVQINGYAYKIKRGVPVLIPVEVMKVIENATMTVYEALGGGPSERRIKRFNYSVLGHFPKSEAQ